MTMNSATGAPSTTPHLNDQPTEPKTNDPAGNLEVHSVWSTIQGEGPFGGLPAVFVRLTGCNMLCPMCDTEYTSKRKQWSDHDLLVEVNRTASKDCKLVVLTGGEPFRQNVAPAINLLMHAGYFVQVETNGTIYREDLPYFSSKFHIVCSPKAPFVATPLINHIRAWKYVLQKGKINPGDGLPTNVLGLEHPPARPPENFQYGSVYIQPLDECIIENNISNMRATVDSCMKFGYRMCLQMHKMVGLR